MDTIEAATAARNFRNLVDEAILGKVTVITRYGKPVAQIGPLDLTAREVEDVKADIAKEALSPPASWRDRQPAQAARDDLLRGFTKPPR